MKTRFAAQSATLLLFTAFGAMGCVPIPISITGLPGSFGPLDAGVLPGMEFEDAEVRIPTGSIDLEDEIDQVRNEIGGIARAVSVNAVMVDSIVFMADPGSSFDFVTDLEIAFLAEGAPENERTVLISESNPNGFGEMVELMVQNDFDLLPFITDADGGNVGEVIVSISGVGPAEEQSWDTTVNMTVVFGLGS